MKEAQDTADAEAVLAHLRACDARFVPPLSGRVDLPAYAAKIAKHARRFEAWSGAELVALVALYDNDGTRETGFVTSVSVLPGWSGRGLARRLLAQAIAHAQAAGLRRVALDVAAANTAALALYRTLGFRTEAEPAAGWLHLALDLHRPPGGPIP